MIYFFRAENADVIDTYADNEIWRWDFEIEPGTYRFAAQNGINNISVLTSSLGSSFSRDGYMEDEKVVVNEGDSVRLYCMFGEWEWREQPEQLENLIEYAKHREEVIDKNMNPYKPETTEVEETTVISVEGEDPAAIVEEEPEITEAEPTLIPEANMEVEENEKKAGNFKGLAIAIILIIVTLGGVYYYKKTNNL